MRRLTTESAGSEITAAFLNALQDEQCGLVPGSENPAGALALTGVDGRYLCTPDAGVLTGHLAVLDGAIDWRGRALWGAFVHLESAAQRMHGASSWQACDPTRAIALRSFRGPTGTGALGAAAATVATGTPPVVGVAGAFAVVVDEGATAAARVYLYADPTNGSLLVYNNSGATLHGEWFVWASAASITPGDAPPDIIPTLTDLLWLAPTAAADRPAAPAGAAIHRATDTGDVTLYDGAVWRSSFGGGGASSPTTTRGDLIRRGASADERLALGSAGKVLTSDGTDAVWSSVAPVLVPQVGANYTGSNGVGTATPASFTLSVGSGITATAPADQPHITKAHGADPHQFEASARLSAATGVDANSYASMRVADASGSVWLLAQVDGAGTVTVYCGATLIPTSAPTFVFDGAGWLRVVNRDGAVSFYTGRGAPGAVDWTLRYRGEPTFPTGSNTFALFGFWLYQGSGAAGPVSVTWADVAFRSVI